MKSMFRLAVVVLSLGVLAASGGLALAVNRTGTDGADRLYGTGGTDELQGRGGDDLLSGRYGTDLLRGGAGNDRIRGGQRRDSAIYDDHSAAVTANLGTGVATSGEDRDSLSSIETLVGGSGDDRLTGNHLRNTLSGGRGDDRLTGGGGNDTLFGWYGRDEVQAGAGNDHVFTADAEPDTINCGTGYDIVSADRRGTDTVRNCEDVSRSPR